MFKKIDKLLIFTAIIVVMIGTVAILIGRKNVEINTKQSENMNANYSTTESNAWDVSAYGDGSVTATLAEDGTLTISGTGKMKNWAYNGATDWYGAKDNVKSVIIEQGITSIGSNAFHHCTSLTSIELPSSLTSIGVYAFYCCESLTSIELSSGLTSIGDSAFSYCTSLTSINIPDGVTSIGSEAFWHCESLKNIELPSGLTSIEEKTFEYCESLTNIELPSGLTSIGENAFSYCTSLTSIGLPSGLTSIGSEAFFNCASLTNIELPSGLTSIGNSAFSYCKSFTSIELPSSLTRIEKYTFGYCVNLSCIELPSGLTNIGEKAFYNCTSLTSINIPDGVTSIGSEAFWHCESLKKIELPSSLTSIEEKAFYNCTSLTIYCNSNSVAETYAKSNSISYIIDDEAPTLKSVQGNPTEWTKENVTLTINAEDSLVGLSEKAYSFDGGETWQAENAKTYEQHERVIIKVRDKLGNIAIHNIEVKIDKQAPTITSVEGNPTEWTKENVTLTVKSQDNLSGFGENSYSFDGGTTWQAENTKIYEENTSGIIIKIKDQAGNETTYEETIEITKIDKQAPIITSVEGNPTEWTKENVRLTINAQDSLSGLAEKTYSFDGGETWQAENTKTYTENTSGIVIKVKDQAGNETTYDETIEITKIDKQAPTITSVEGNPEEWTKENVTLRINGAQDSLSGLAEKPYSFDGGATWQAEHTKTYEENTSEIVVQVKDNVGNVITYEETIEITKIDKQAPTITSIDGNPTEWTKGNVILTINAQDSLSGLAETPYSFDGGETWQVENTKTYTKNTEGIIIKVKDKLDNIATYDEIDIDKISELEIELESYAVKQEGNNTYITNIAPETTIGEFIGNIETNGTIEIYKGTDQITDIDTSIGTGMTVKITLNSEKIEYIVVIKGDINGDGNAKLSDLSKLKLAVIGKTELEGAYKEAADINGDGNVKLSDLSKMKLYLVGKARL